jgi:hypothetical protein
VTNRGPADRARYKSYYKEEYILRIRRRINIKIKAIIFKKEIFKIDNKNKVLKVNFLFLF